MKLSTLSSLAAGSMLGVALGAGMMMMPQGMNTLLSGGMKNE